MLHLLKNGLRSKKGLPSLNKRLTAKLREETGAAHLEMVVNILIVVVLGALLLGGLYLLFANVVLPELSLKITDMFDYTP